MADNRAIKIEILDSRGAGSPTPNTPTVFNKDGKPTNTIVQNTNPLGAVLANQAFEQAKSLVKNATSFYVNRQLTLKENYIAERNLQNALNSINKGVGLVTAVAGGFALGNIGGAIVGGVGWAANEGLNQFKRYDTAYRELNTENINLAFNRTRAGLIGESGTEN